MASAMRAAMILISLLALGGCAASKPPTQATVRPRPYFQDTPTVALAFAPPITQGELPIFLSRDERQPAAVMGFYDTTATYFYTESDEIEFNPITGWLARRAYSAKVGVSYR